MYVAVLPLLSLKMEACSYSSAAVFEDMCGCTSTADVKDM